MLLLDKLGACSPADLTAVPRERPERVPTFAEYVPVVSAAVTDGTRKAYGSYWNRVVEHWGGRRLDEPTPSEIRQLMKLVKANVVQRRTRLDDQVHPVGEPLAKLTGLGDGAPHHVRRAPRSAPPARS